MFSEDMESHKFKTSNLVLDFHKRLYLIYQHLACLFKVNNAQIHKCSTNVYNFCLQADSKMVRKITAAS